MKNVIGPLAFQTLHWGLFYAWQGLGMQGAGNVLVAWLWVLSILAILAFVFGDPKPRPPHPVWRRAFGVLSRISTIVLAAALAWVGHQVLAIFILFMVFAGAVFSKREVSAYDAA